MLVSRIASRSSRAAAVAALGRRSLLECARKKEPREFVLFNSYYSVIDPRNMVVAGQESLLHHMNLNRYSFQHSNMFSSTSSQPDEKDTAQCGNESGTVSKKTADGTKAEVPKQGDASEQAEISSEEDSDSKSELSRDDLVKLVADKEEQLKSKHEELQQMKDKALRTYAEMQNSMDRTRREADNLKKFAIQDFAKNLLDVADNLSRACSVVKKDFSKIDDTGNDAALKLLKTLLQGVEMTEKQLAEVFKKYGVEKYDPLDEEFDPNRHNAVFQVPDPSKAPGTVAHVLKAGYMLHERVLRPAEVGVTQAVEVKEPEESSEA